MKVADMNLNNINNVHALAGKYNFATGGKVYKENTLAQSNITEMQNEHSEKISNMKRMIAGSMKKQEGRTSVLDSTLKYGESIRASRTAAKDTASSLKKLKYNFKDISSQIRRSKTSVNAKQVASKARREVVQLKSKLATGKYDEEELQAAIEHAKSMERAAKKKARHLEEEELVKVTDSNGNEVSVADFEEQMEEKADKAYEEYEAELEAQKEEAISEINEEQIAMMEQAIAESMEEVQAMMEESMEASMEEVTEDMYDLLAESMEDIMEETLGDLAESMMAMTDYEMDEEEFKTFKLKHRANEEKAMLEADAKYLKAIFDMYSRRMGGGSPDMKGIGGVTSTGVDGFPGFSGVASSGDIASQIPNVVDISL